jgi:heterodisulfide reductase subunit A
VEESIIHGRASATKLYGLLNLGYTFVDPFVAFVDVNRCSGCKACETACLGNAIKFDEEKRVAYVEETSCVGCGLCNSICPSSAIQLKGYYFDNPIEEEVSALLEAI